jgi:hypothetical protein
MRTWRSWLIGPIIGLIVIKLVDAGKLRSWHDSSSFLDGIPPAPVHYHGFTEANGLLYKFGGLSFGSFASLRVNFSCSEHKN